MDATATPALVGNSTLTSTNPPLFAAFASLLARAHRPARTERRRPAGWTGMPADRDHERLLADLRALPGTPADLASL